MCHTCHCSLHDMIHTAHCAWAWIFYMFVGVRRTSKYDPKELQKRPLYKAIIAFKSTKKLTVNHQHAFCSFVPFRNQTKISNTNSSSSFIQVTHPHPFWFTLQPARQTRVTRRQLRPDHPHGTKGLGCTKESQHGDITRSGGAIGQGCLSGVPKVL